MEIYERIKARRKEMGLSAEDVAKALGVSRATIYRYESADIEKLPTSILEPLSDVLKCSIPYLMGWEDAEKIADNLYSVTISPEIQQLVSIVSDMNPEQINKIIEYAEFIKGRKKEH